MPESANPELTAVQLLRKAQKLMGLPDLPHIAYIHLFPPWNRKRLLTRSEETVVNFEFALYEYPWGMAFQVLARYATENDAGPEVWQCLARAAALLDLDDRQTELLRRGLKQEMSELPNRAYPQLNFEHLLRLAMKEMRLPAVRFAKKRQMEGFYPTDPCKIVAWKFEDFWQSSEINGAWHVLAEYATSIRASHICWELLAEAAKFLTLTTEQADMLRRGLVGVDAS